MTGRPFHAALIVISVLWIVLSTIDPAMAARDAWVYAAAAVLLLTAGRAAEHTDREDRHGRRR